MHFKSIKHHAGANLWSPQTSHYHQALVKQPKSDVSGKYDQKKSNVPLIIRFAFIKLDLDSLGLEPIKDDPTVMTAFKVAQIILQYFQQS